MLSCSRHSMKIFSLSSLCNSRRNNILRVWNIAMVYLSRDCHFASSHANAKKLRYIWGHFPCFLLWSLSSIERLQIIDKEKEHAENPCQYQSIGNAWSILFWLPHSDKEKGAPLLHHSFLKASVMVIETFLTPGRTASASLAQAASFLLLAPSNIPGTVVRWLVSF